MGKSKKKSVADRIERFNGVLDDALAAHGEKKVLSTIAAVPRFGMDFASSAAVKAAVQGHQENSAAQAPLEPAVRNAFRRALEGLSSDSRQKGKERPGNKFAHLRDADKLIGRIIEHFGTEIGLTVLSSRMGAGDFGSQDDVKAHFRSKTLINDRGRLAKAMDTLKHIVDHKKAIYDEMTSDLANGLRRSLEQS